MELRDVIGMVPYGKYNDRVSIAASRLRTAKYMIDVEAKIQALYIGGKRGKLASINKLKSDAGILATGVSVNSMDNFTRPHFINERLPTSQITPALYYLGGGPIETINSKSYREQPINDIFTLIPIDKQHNCENGISEHLLSALHEYVYDKNTRATTAVEIERVYNIFLGRMWNSHAKDTFGIDLPSKGINTPKLHSKEKQALAYYAPIAAGDLFPGPLIDILWGRCRKGI